MKTIKHKVQCESNESMMSARRVNPGLEVVIDAGPLLEGLVLPIGAGDADDVHVYQDGDEYFVLNINYRVDYVGLEVFNADGYSVGNVFVSNDIHSVLGKQGLDTPYKTMIRTLMEYV